MPESISHPFLHKQQGSYTESRIHFLYGIKGSMEQLKKLIYPLMYQSEDSR